MALKITVKEKKVLATIDPDFWPGRLSAEQSATIISIAYRNGHLGFGHTNGVLEELKVSFLFGFRRELVKEIEKLRSKTVKSA